jgi:hypothetical protein
MPTDAELRIAAIELRNYANTLLNLGGVTGFYITQILKIATALDGQQPDERFSDIPHRLANPRCVAAPAPEHREVGSK